jgi:hypothetical protein
VKLRPAFAASLVVVLAACGAAGGNAAGSNVTQADATQQRPVPCAVERHGMSAVINGVTDASCDNSVDPQAIGLDELIRVIPNQHPYVYFVLAGRLYYAGRRDEAVFWFYAGQLRYRIRLACHPGLQQGTEAALFTSLFETIGRPINEYGAGDPPALAATMERVLAWDAATHNGFEPKAACAVQIAQQREGLGQLMAETRTGADEIRRQRTANGLPNR